MKIDKSSKIISSLSQLYHARKIYMDIRQKFLDPLLARDGTDKASLAIQKARGQILDSLHKDSKEKKDSTIHAELAFQNEIRILGENDFATREAIISFLAFIFPAMKMDNGFLNEFRSRIRVFHAEDVADKNAYLKNILFDSDISMEQKSDDHVYSLSVNRYLPYEPFLWKNQQYGKYMMCIPCVGIFDTSFEFPTLEKDGEALMAVSPYTIHTMGEDMQASHGKGLVLGLGLGYFPYMALQKKNVESVTVVEHDQNVIDLFRQHILPQFGDEERDRITIIHDDAFHYMENISDGLFDFCYADIWSSPMEVDTYLRIKELNRKFKRMECRYWIEDALVGYLQSYIYVDLIRFFCQVSHMVFVDPNTKMKLPEEMAREREYIEKKLKNYHVKQPRDIENLMNPKWLARKIS